MIYYQEPHATLYQGDALEVLKQLPIESVDMCVTSPPYYGLREYGTASWEGGSDKCDHLAGVHFSDKSSIRNTALVSTIKENNGKGTPYKDICGKCGATRMDLQIGLEKTPEEYVAKLVAIFREVRRVLKKEGTLWLNLGDSYASGGSGQNFLESASRNVKVGTTETLGGYGHIKTARNPHDIGLKPKDLIGIPWRVAFALQADGWWLRQDIIWAKGVSGNIRSGSVMPESVRDRFCKSHEYVFLLTKSARYYFDTVAVADTIDNQESHEYNSKYENEDLQQMQIVETDREVLQEQPAERWLARDLPRLPITDSEEVGPQVQSDREIQVERETILLFREGTESQKVIQRAVCSDPRTKGTIPDCRTITREGSQVQGTSQKIRPKRKGKTGEVSAGYALRQNGKGEIFQTQDGNQAQVSDQDNRLHVDNTSMAGNQDEVRASLCILRESNGEIREGPCDTAIEGRDTHSLEHSTGLPDMQRQKGRKDFTPEQGGGGTSFIGHSGYKKADGTLICGNKATRRSVWLINPQPYKKAHFATYPPALVEPCILAGCPANGVVLDPFAGSGTTLAVAKTLNRKSIGIELNPDYCKLCVDRLQEIPIPMELGV